MKYIELKSKLKETIENNYLIFGEDRYLCFDALKKIEEAININIQDMNKDVISGEKASAKDIISSANLYPFGDEKRLVIVKNYAPSKNKEEFELLQNYLKNPLKSTILIFFNPENSDFLKTLSNLTQVDCNKIDTKFVYAYIKNKLNKEEIEADDEAIEKLILYCNNDMLKVSNELEKLISFLQESKQLKTDIVEQFVAQDKEYQVFQLSEFLAKGDVNNAIALVDSFCYNPGSAFTIISPLFNNYRRVLFVALNKDKTNAELANLLGVKEYAIKFMQNQVKVFSPKKLKKIVSMIAKYDEKIKIGEMKEKIAIKMLVFNILNNRGQND